MIYLVKYHTAGDRKAAAARPCREEDNGVRIADLVHAGGPASSPTAAQHCFQSGQIRAAPSSLPLHRTGPQPMVSTPAACRFGP